MKQNEVWLINLDPSVGAEIKKTRPAVIVNDDSLGKLPLKVIVPITDWKDSYQIAPWMIKIGLSNKSGLLPIVSKSVQYLKIGLLNGLVNYLVL
mgnify:CR=1 FL=1